MSENPLLNYVRKKSGFYKLPTNGGWYDADEIEYNQLGEVEVFPMVSADELLLVNPDGLVSGQSVISLIKSCCPGIKHQGNLYYPDINTLLLAIRKETYGDTVEQVAVCPKCYEKQMEVINKYYLNLLEKEKINVEDITEEQYNELVDRAKKESEEEIASMERENKIMVRPQTFEFNIDELLGSSKILPPEKIIKTSDGLKIYVTPMKCSEKIKFMNSLIQEKRIIKYASEQKTDYTKLLTNELKDKANEIYGLYSEYSKLIVDAYSTSISKIKLPDGNEVTDSKFISEYLNRVDIKLGNEIKSAIDELNGYGIPQKLDLECECCGHKWEEKFYGYNMSDFFGISS